MKHSRANNQLRLCVEVLQLEAARLPCKLTIGVWPCCDYEDDKEQSETEASNRASQLNLCTVKAHP